MGAHVVYRRRLGRWLLNAIGAALLLLAAPAEAVNSVEIRPAESSVPAAMNPGTTASVRIRVVNNGTTTWSPAALHRIGAQYTGATNQVTWSAFACGGYTNSAID